MSLKVSIVVAAHNSASTIGAAVSSALWQSHRDLEVVVVDDGSTDETATIVDAHEDPRLMLLHQANAGAGSARNTGMQAASGALITFLDSDDLLLGRHVEALVSAWRASHPRTIATANSYWLLPGGIDPSHTRHKGRFPEPDTQRRRLLEQNFLSPMSLFPRELLDEVLGFDASLERSEDWDFWLRAVFAGYRVVHQPRPLSLFRWGQVSMSTDLELVTVSDRAILQRMLGRDDLTPYERAYILRRLASPSPRELGNLGDAALRAGDYPEAARRYRAAARLVPSETMLLRKARVLSAAPRVLGPLIRSRQVRRESALAFDPSFQH